MFKIEELSGSLIRSGKFKEAIPQFNSEMVAAMEAGCLGITEFFFVNEQFQNILLNPSNMDDVEALSTSMIRLALRIPNYVKVIPYEAS